MKEPLLKPPPGDGEILILPGVEEFSAAMRSAVRVATCHQLGFFHPGIALRLHLVDGLGRGRGLALFMDTDRTALQVRLPTGDGRVRVFDLRVSDRPLCLQPALGNDVLCVFFREVKQELGAELIREGCEVLREYERFVEIVMDQDERLPLRERMAEAFDRYSNLSVSHRYLSDLVGGRDFDDFFMTIRGEAGRFRRVYNRTLERFRERFRFRFRNYPFPELKEGELPFWVIRDGRRHQFTTDMDDGDVEGYTILPKASPLTLFLRMHHCDLFVHGVGGANYEWVNDRIYEEFFGLDPPRYLVLSGTFHQCGIPERDYPYFFMNPRRLKSLLEKRLHGARGDAGS